MFDLLLLKLNVFAAFNTGAPCTPKSGNSFFGFPVWWKYIKQGEQDGLGNCVPKVTFPEGFWPIAFAVVDMLLYLAGILAVIFIIVGGFAYMTAGGNPEKAAEARKKVFNAAVGLVIVLLATAFVAFVGRRFG